MLIFGNRRPERALLCAVLLLILVGSREQANGECVSDGSDGPFHPLVSQTIDLDTAAPDGVFNFTTINIPAGITIRFNRNTLNTPVFFKATGDVVIDGVIDVSTGGRIGGPGGGDGGIGGGSAGDGSGTSGTGPSPGSGGVGTFASGALGQAGGGGGMATAGLEATSRTAFPPALGGPLVAFPAPFRGGSGGGGGGRGRIFGVDLQAGNGGGAGGGLRICTPGNITIRGMLRANGAHGGVAFANIFSHGGPGGGGSGGAFDLIGNSITVEPGAVIQAIGGAGGGLSTEPVSQDPFFFSSGANGGLGYVRFTANDLSVAITVDAVVAPVPVPVLSGWALAFIGSAIAGLGAVLARSRRSSIHVAC